MAYGRERVHRRRHRPLKAKPEAQVAFRAEREARLEDGPKAWEPMFVDEATGHRHPPLTAQGCVVEALRNFCRDLAGVIDQVGR